jgi:hypothetical protein
MDDTGSQLQNQVYQGKIKLIPQQIPFVLHIASRRGS